VVYLDKRKKRQLPVSELANTDVSVVLAASKLFEGSGIRHSVKREAAVERNVYLALNILNLKHPRFSHMALSTPPPKPAH